MKKIFLIVVVIGLLLAAGLVLAGCGESKDCGGDCGKTYKELKGCPGNDSCDGGSGCSC